MDTLETLVLSLIYFAPDNDGPGAIPGTGPVGRRYARAAMRRSLSARVQDGRMAGWRYIPGRFDTDAMRRAWAS